ncbi:MAG TPA: type I phosphomannose isomerase catalytic subunit [Ktedonobacteraceae bacterium]|nr:type I phosphomannose isomerase catalytic subunit [Ktedonobacteraceae bacterium]
MQHLYPIRLQASLHETLWGGRNLERDGWKLLPQANEAIGEAWETEISTVVQNGRYAGSSLGMLVEQLGSDLLGEQVCRVFGERFPLLAKFIDANAQLSVQVHPKDEYAAIHEGGKLGKTEYWYILAAEPEAKIVYGFKTPTNREAVRQAIESVTLDTLLQEVSVEAGDIIFVPAGTVHAIGNGIVLYELQEYSDVTYRMYDYGRLSATGKPRELHIEKSLEVAHYEVPAQVKARAVTAGSNGSYQQRYLVACKYFVSCELLLREQSNEPGIFSGSTAQSCIILSSLGAEVQVSYGENLQESERLKRGETMVLPAKLGEYRIAGSGPLLFSYVPTVDDPALQAWQEENSESVL